MKKKTEIGKTEKMRGVLPQTRLKQLFMGWSLFAEKGWDCCSNSRSLIWSIWSKHQNLQVLEPFDRFDPNDQNIIGKHNQHSESKHYQACSWTNLLEFLPSIFMVMEPWKGKEIERGREGKGTGKKLSHLT